MRYVSFSGGADSTALAIYLHEQGEEFELVFADSGAELPETLWFVPRVAKQLGVKLTVVSGPTFFQKLTSFGYLLPSFKLRWCTRELKTKPLEAYAPELAVGICADEFHRMPRAFRPLVDAGITKDEARKLVTKHDLLNPVYRWRSSCSCFCCPFQRIHDWKNLQREHPDLFALAEKWEELSLEASGFAWSDRFTLAELRRYDEAQLEMLREPREQACAICQW